MDRTNEVIDDEMMYQEDENQYIEEAEEVYEDFDDATEYIEVDGRLVAHNPSASAMRAGPSSLSGYSTQTSQQNSDQNRPFTVRERARLYDVERQNPPSVSAVPLRPTYASGPHSIRGPFSATVPSHKNQIIHTQGGSRVLTLADGTTAMAPQHVVNGVAGSMGVPANYINQRKAFYEMKQEVIANRKTSKKKATIPGQRKPCNCTKSQCLKLYCDCFANGEFCRDCNCKDCHNSLEFQNDRTKAIKQSLERNPNAFKPKIGTAKTGTEDIERLHQKGCHCKKSGCLKNYCECYEAKVPCTDRCKCRGCQNTEADRLGKFRDRNCGAAALMSLAHVAASSVGVSDSRPSSVRTEGSSDYGAQGSSSLAGADGGKVEQDPRRFPWFYMTDEVIEAATLCMVAQAEEALSSSSSFGSIAQNDAVTLENMERLVLREFGRCLEQIISNAAEPPIDTPPDTTASSQNQKQVTEQTTRS